MKIPKQLEEYLVQTEKEAKKMMRAFKEPVTQASTNDYHRGRFRTVCEIRELFNDDAFICGECGKRFTRNESMKATKLKCPHCEYCDEHSEPKYRNINDR